MHPDSYLEIITPPASGIVDLPIAKTHLRVDHDDDDSLITAQIKAASRWVVTYLGKSVITTQYRYTLPAFPRFDPGVRLPFPFVQTVDSVTYLDDLGAVQTVDPADYELRRERELWPVPEADGWPEAGEFWNALKIEYTAGYGTTVEAPEEIQTATLLLLGALYEERATEYVGQPPSRLHWGVEQLLSSLRETIL